MTDQTSQRRFLTVEHAAEELNVKSSLIRGLIAVESCAPFRLAGEACGASAFRVWRTTSPKHTGAQLRTLQLAISWTKGNRTAGSGQLSPGRLIQFRRAD